EPFDEPALEQRETRLRRVRVEQTLAHSEHTIAEQGFEFDHAIGELVLRHPQQAVCAVRMELDADERRRPLRARFDETLLLARKPARGEMVRRRGIARKQRGRLAEVEQKMRAPG